MAYVECNNGHLYDPAVNSTCPYCTGNSLRIDFSESDNGIGKTAPVSGAFGPSSPDEIGATVAPSSYMKKAENEKDIGKTVGLYQKKMNIEPVVGWIVCIEGIDKGKDYRILAKNNTVGRSENMDICLKNDSTISRENHARIAYDGKHNAFHLIPAESVNTVYLNDEPVYVPTKLQIHDVIEFGESKFAFVPLCDKFFNWQDGMNKEV